MEWNVKNALSRDVERQQLNKILAEIRASVSAASVTSSAPSSDPRDLIGAMVEGNNESGISVTYDAADKVLDFAVNSFIITLSGDVTGSAEVNGLNSITINTTLAADLEGVEEAPIDSEAYWRRTGEWEQVNLDDFTTDDLDEGVVNFYARYYRHDQPVAAATWTINHNAGRGVQVVPYTVGGLMILASVLHVNDNQAQILFDAPYDGYAIVQ